jgi:hypothetical protein
MDFLNNREGGVFFYQDFLLSPSQCAVTHYRNCKRLREFEET